MNPPYHNEAANQAAPARNLLGSPNMILDPPTEAMKRRAKKLALRWGMDVKHVMFAVVHEASMKAFLRKVGVPAAIVAQVALVKIGDTVCLNERPLNDVNPVKMMEVRARIGNVMGWAP